MEIKVEVEIYNGSGRSTVDIFLDGTDIRALAEQKAINSYACDSCAAKGIETTVRL